MLVVPPNTFAGNYTRGEKPVPLQYQFLDAANHPIPITGFQVRWQLVDQASATAPQLLTGTVADGPNGVAQYMWLGTDWSCAGRWLGQFWVGNTVQRYASLILVMDVAESLGPVPNI